MVEVDITLLASCSSSPVALCWWTTEHVRYQNPDRSVKNRGSIRDTRTSSSTELPLSVTSAAISGAAVRGRSEVAAALLVQLPVVMS
jgi:hypothetical protein